MPRYSVRIPVSGVFEVEIEAENEEAAIAAAMLCEPSEMEDFQELELHEKLHEGNVCNAVLHEIEVEELKEDEEEDADAVA